LYGGIGLELAACHVCCPNLFDGATAKPGGVASERGAGDAQGFDTIDRASAAGSVGRERSPGIHRKTGFIFDRATQDGAVARECALTSFSVISLSFFSSATAGWYTQGPSRSEAERVACATDETATGSREKQGASFPPPFGSTWCPMSEVTRILSAIDQGDPHAAEQLLPLIYDELRKLAAQKLSNERPGQTLEPTALVHEAYLRLMETGMDESARGSGSNWANRRHFFVAAAEAMRRILVEKARHKRRDRHGGRRQRQYPDLDELQDCGPSDEILALHEALEQFAVHDPLKAKLVELRFFGGLTLDQAAKCLDISLSTADRSWRYARAWLYAVMSGDHPEKKIAPS
jgi:RNA polymerase sigma factor (TIGR02999 family)